jgi:tetratricopeptide (TPR) repeat protein
MALRDCNKLPRALKIAEDGLKNFDDDNYHLLFAAGDALYRAERYKEAAGYFKKAFSKVSETTIQVDTAMMAAISYYKAADKKNAWKWYEKALKKLDDNPAGKTEITKLWLRLRVSLSWLSLGKWPGAS